MTAQQQFIEPKNLNEFNQCLIALALPMVNADQLTSMREHEPRDRLINALQQARTKKNAKIYLENVLNNVGVNEETPNQANTPAPEPEFVDTRQASSLEEDMNNMNQPNQTSSSAPAPAPVPTKPKQDFLGHHVYGGKAALYFRAEKIEGKEGKNDWHTIMIDAALSTGPRQFNWKDKICIRLTPAEMPQVAAVFLGFATKVNFANHGPKKDKGFSVEHQGKSIFINLNEKGKKAHAIPVSVSDAYVVGNLFLRQLRAEQQWMNSGDIINSLKFVVGRMLTPPR